MSAPKVMPVLMRVGPSAAAILQQLLQAVTLLRTWLRRARLRHELSLLSDEQMRDAGLTREIVMRESEKPFWMV
ncbi:MAG TPA: DUF1127 domain-containing protein [Hyphomicrobiaceae bacterium]|nr:DUF1127 domain-containing protein [Hyphomicrobiaceae bacterium]